MARTASRSEDAPRRQSSTSIPSPISPVAAPQAAPDRNEHDGAQHKASNAERNHQHVPEADAFDTETKIQVTAIVSLKRFTDFDH